jgi:CRISPR/Cas system endoribonuclease Cas6 (RAMP superfamily)
MSGYLIPFVLHAHPKVQKFIWDAGLGLYCNNGFGMIDIVAPREPNT